MIEAKVVLDSVAPNGVRLTTFELTYPRFIHAELMTHRLFSRNAASSRAVPTRKKIERIRASMAKPVEWGLDQKGMQSGEALTPVEQQLAERLWENACFYSLEKAEQLDKLRVHKQVANRIIEPWDHITVVLSTTKLRNHFKLRLEVDPTGRPMADPNYYALAQAWKAAYDASTPRRLEVGEWHLPYTGEEDVQELSNYKNLEHDPDALSVLKKISVGRCARVSYMRQGQGDVEENIKLHDRLAASGHWSPFEHVATPIDGIRCGFVAPMECNLCQNKFEGPAADLNLGRGWLIACMKCALGHVTSGNFHGWKQYRKEFSNEAGGD